VSDTHDCSYCRYIQCLQIGLPVDLWNTPLARSQNFHLVPTLGMLIPGWCLITANTHQSRFLETPYQNQFELIDFVSRARTKVATKFGDNFIFEHGPATSQQSGSGSCIDHAHFHIIPCFPAYEDLILAASNFVRIEGMFLLNRENLVGKNYLYFENHASEKYISFVENVKNQFIRRIVADALNRSDQFDWAVFPEFDNVALTIDMLRGADGKG
jgi:hypothetical protein